MAVLGPDRGHAGDVVRGVSGQRQQILELSDAHAEALFDLGHAEHAIAHGVPHDRAFADELHQILVRGDDHHLQIVLGGALDRARDQVIGLHAVLLEDRDVEGAHDLLAARHLLLQIRRRRRTIGFVRS